MAGFSRSGGGDEYIARSPNTAQTQNPELEKATQMLHVEGIRVEANLTWGLGVED